MNQSIVTREQLNEHLVSIGFRSSNNKEFRLPLIKDSREIVVRTTAGGSVEITIRQDKATLFSCIFQRESISYEAIVRNIRYLVQAA